MRFNPNGPVIPDGLLERCDAGRVVFLCGAGVSFPSGMPNFVGLTQHVIKFFDPPEDSEIVKAFQPWLENSGGINMPLDQIFNLLHQEYGKDEVNALVTQRLAAPNEAADIGYQHNLIKRISSNTNGIPQIVTTNFDLLFELDGQTRFHVPPAFPDLAFGTSIEGITYLHGRLAEPEAEHHPYVLSSADFGRAYLSEAWATNFIRNLLNHYTVVLVGYQAEDPPIKYLLQGLNHDGQYDRTRLYAFDKGRPEDIEAKWRDRGVSAIAYDSHEHLWHTMEEWAARADNPREWRASIIQTAQQDPKDLLSHQRGQVAHVLRSVKGTKIFSEAQPSPHAEWVCVMDANVRSADAAQCYGDNAETFDPKHAYGLDDDLDELADEDRRRGSGNDNILQWRYGDDSPTDSHRLGGRQPEGHEIIPPRLWHLVTWMAKSIDSPVLAWWAIRQNGIHPRLLRHIEWHLEQKKDLHQRARQCWNLIIEHHKDPRNREWDGSWFDLNRRVASDGWTAGTLRDFRRIGRPRVEIKPPLGLDGARPPKKNWSEIGFGELGQLEVKVLDRHTEDLEVPDDVLVPVFGVVQDQLLATSGLLADIETQFFQTPTCYPGREIEGELHYSDAADVMVSFLRLFDRLADKFPVVARGHVMTWPIDDQYFFQKLTLYALSKSTLFQANDVTGRVLSLDQDVFWDSSLARELLFLLVDRWEELAIDHKQMLAERLLAGPDRRGHWSDKEYPKIRSEFSARYCRYLELQGCALPAEHGVRLHEIIAGIERWSDGWAISTVVEHGSYSGWVGADETPDAVVDLPVRKIVERAKVDLKRDFDSFTEKRPFTGLVKTKPRKALTALTVAGKNGDYPEVFWSALINDLPDDISPRLKRLFLHRLTRLPLEAIQVLRHALARWLETNLADLLEFDENLGWTVYDHIVDGVIAGGAEAAESGLGEVRLAGQIINQSRRTVDHAINGPIGMCADALLRVVSRKEQKEGSLIPKPIKNRLERLFAAPGEGSDHAVAVTLQRLNWLMYVDSDWSERRLIPMLAFEHPASEPAWNGLLHCGQPLWPPLAQTLKPLLLALYPWVERQSWGREIAKLPAQWLGLMCIFKRDKPDGLTASEMRSALRNMTDGTRNSFIFWLGRVGQKNEDGWNSLVAPFLREVWPRERAFRTAFSINAWIGLLDDTGESFLTVYEAAKPFLAPMEIDRNPFYRFTRMLNDEEPITSRFPEATLDLLHTVTPRTLARPAYELPNILAVIAETEPSLMSDPRYLRLIDLVDGS